MKIVFGLAAGSVLWLAACVQAPQGQTGNGASTAMLPGRQLLVFFDSGYDEPPTGGILVDCDAPSGVCVDTGGAAPLALARGANGWSYQTTAGYRTILNDDGRGYITVPNQPNQPVDWMTEPWS